MDFQLVENIVCIFFYNLFYKLFIAEAFIELWPNLANVFEQFLFSSRYDFFFLIKYLLCFLSKSELPLNADERKRHEFVDCLIIELIRTQILPYYKILPWDFMQKVIDILNRGSINTMDAKDVMGTFF